MMFFLGDIVIYGKETGHIYSSMIPGKYDVDQTIRYCIITEDGKVFQDIPANQLESYADQWL